MSAIAGIVFFNEAPLPHGLIERMTAAMAVRGPDGIQHWQSTSTAFGHCRFCTTPESLHEQQPLLLEDGSAVLVFAGRIDNRGELRRDLLAHGLPLRDDTDAELVLRSWQCWGEDSPNRLLGDFVYFIWCSKTRRLFGARDVAGTRNCYYAAGNGWFAFASEMQALLATGLLAARVNKEFIYDYLGDEFDRIDANASWFEGIQRLPLAHCINATAAGHNSRRYWQVESQPQRTFASMDECREAFLEVLTQAVECRLRSNGPVGVMLSGGMDSSAITALACKRLQHRLQQPLHSYSLVRAQPQQCVDSPYIQAMLADNPLQATIIDSNLSAEQFQRYLVMIASMESPHGITDAMPHLPIAEAAQARGCRVLLDGFAADLLFRSPESSLELAFKHHKWSSLPAILSSWRQHRIDGAGNRLLRLAARELLPTALTGPYRRYNQQRRQRLDLEASIGNSLLRRQDAIGHINSRQALRQQLDLPISAARPLAPALPALLRPMLGYAYEVNEPLFARHHVELRGPFSDRRVLEFAFSMPLEAGFALGFYKSFLRECMTGYIPDSVLRRSQIIGHPGGWFFEGLMNYSKTEAQEFWNLPAKDDVLKRLLDAKAVDRLFTAVSTTAEFEAAGKWMKLAVLSRWLHTFDRTVF